jgi:hypothetical protein
VQALNVQSIWATPFDRLSLAIRHDLLAAAWPILKAWPENFLKFSQNTGLTVVDFNEDRVNLPRWMLTEIDTHLGQAGRYVTSTQVEHAIAQLRGGGLPINAQRVSKLVGSLSAKAVVQRLKKRNSANPLERIELAEGLNDYLRSGSSYRRSSVCVRARNVLAVGMAILKGTTFEDAVKFTWDDVNTTLAAASQKESWTQKLLEIMMRAKTMIYLLQGVHNGSIGYFVPHKGVSLNLRGPRNAFLHATRGMDFGLRKQISSFYSN